MIDAIEGIHHFNIGLGQDLEIDYGPQNHKGYNRVIFGVVRNGSLVTFTDWKTVR